MICIFIIGYNRLYLDFVEVYTHAKSFVIAVNPHHIATYRLGNDKSWREVYATYKFSPFREEYIGLGEL